MKNWNRLQTIQSALLLLLIACVGFTTPGFAQRGGGVNSSGTDYWITFLPNYLQPADNIRLFVASGTVNKVFVEVYGGSKSPQQTFTQTMQPDKVWTLSFPSTRQVESRTQEVPEYKAVHVHSQNPIAVYGLSNVYTTTDSYLAIPTPALGTEYFPACMYDDNYFELSPTAYPEPLAGEFAIIAPYDNTIVTIGPVKTDTRSDPTGTVSHPEGSSWTITLNQGQTYLVQSTGLKPGDGDLTGTHVISSKPIGMISGHQRCRMPVDGKGNSKDHIMEMMIPVDKWGTQYFDMPQGGRLQCGNYIRLIAGEDGCYVTENGQGIAQLNKAGDWVDRELVLDPVVYKSNGKKFMVVEYSYSQGYNGDAIQSDPFEIIMTPQNQFQKKMIFRVPNNVASGTEYDNYGTFICQKDSINRIVINGKRITGYQFAGQADFPATTPQMSAYRIKFPDQTATYVATCGAPFACYIYGFSYAESYGHPAGMALNTTSPDTLPPLEVMRDSACGDFHVQLLEPRHFPKFSFEDTKIADIALINDPSDFRWPKPSTNYRFEWDPAHPFTSGDSNAYYYLRINDGSKPGYAAVWTTDRAGNDTVYEYSYTPPSIDGSPSPLVINNVWVEHDSIARFVLHNYQNGDVTISGDSILGYPAGEFSLVNSPGTVKIKAGDSLVLNIKYRPKDTVSSVDTLKLLVNDCLPFLYPLQGSGVIPQIVADDLNFGSVNVGDTICKQLTVRNVGKLPFELTKNWILKNTSEFSFQDASNLPITIDPGRSATLTLCFHPDTTGAVQSRQDWATNETAPFAHSIKDTSSLLGFGRAPGLEWDRGTQDFYVECDTQVIRMNLVNSSPSNTGAPVDVTNLSFSGADAGEFSIIDSKQGYLPPTWHMDAANSIWVDVLFKPDRAKGYAPRTAKLVATGSSNEKTFTPEILLSGYVRHSTMNITPTTFDFGKVQNQSALSTTYWIHNDGDTDLVLTNVSADGIYSISGFTPGEHVKPHDSVQVTLNGTATLGTMPGTISVTNAASCTPNVTATATAFSSVYRAEATGHDYGDVYVCQNNDALIQVKNTGTENALLKIIEIFDSAGTNGASQFVFPNGKQFLNVGLSLDTGTTQTFTVKFTPTADLPANAWVRYILIVPERAPDTIVQRLSGTGLHYANTVTAQRNDVDNVYHATIGGDLTVPIRLTQNFDAKAKVYGFTYKLRYKRDMFEFRSIQPVAGLTNSTATPVVDPTDNTYETLTVTETSSSPITAGDIVANVNFTYMLNLQTSTPIEVSDVAFMDQSGNTVCWVTPDAVPGSFQGNDICGDSTLRDVLNGKLPSWISRVRPNPTMGQASVEYGVRTSGTPVRIELFDMLGKKVQTVVAETSVNAGDHIATVDSVPLSGGTYIVRLWAGSTVQSVRLVVTK